MLGGWTLVHVEDHNILLCEREQPVEDVSGRVALYVLAAMLPGIADNLDVVPVIGAYANGFLDQFAVFIAGVAIANLFTVLVKGLRDA